MRTAVTLHKVVIPRMPSGLSPYRSPTTTRKNKSPCENPPVHCQKRLISMCTYPLPSMVIRLSEPPSRRFSEDAPLAHWGEEHIASPFLTRNLATMSGTHTPTKLDG
jgi:hypothetical protein